MPGSCHGPAAFRDARPRHDPRSQRHGVRFPSRIRGSQPGVRLGDPEGITASTLLAQKLAGQPPSTAPADAAEKLIGVEPKGEQEKQRLTNLVHFAYGAAWGVPRALLGLFGVRERSERARLSSA
jgi:hypothetical protein